MSRKPEDKVLSQLNNAVLEHLEQSGYVRVAKILKDEIEKGPPSVAPKQGVQSARGQKKEATMSPQANLMLIQQNFDKGNKVEFFKVFESFIPAEMKKKDIAYKKLEFFLQIYFVVYIKHPNISHQSISE